MQLPDIAITGRAGSGKDTVAEYLTLRFGYTRLALADPLRDMAYAINPLVADGLRLREVVDGFGWDSAKTQPEIRRLLQVIGTEGVRNVLGQETWLQVLAQKYQATKAPVVVTDVRFQNEAEFLTGLGFHLVRVVGRSLDSVPAHASETEMEQYPVDTTLANVSSKDDLNQLLDGLVERHIR